MISPPSDVSEFLIYRASYSAEYEVFVFFGVSVSEVLQTLKTGTPISPEHRANVKTYVFKAPSEQEYDSRELIRKWIVGMGIDPKVADSCSSWRLYAVVNGHGFPPNFQDHPLQEVIDRTPKLIKRHMVPRDMFDPLAGSIGGIAFYD